MNLTLISKADTLPVSLDDVKANIGINTDDQDNIVLQKIAEAVEIVQGETGKTFADHTWEESYPCWRDVKLSRAPLKSVAWVKYYPDDDSDDQATLDPSSYFVQKPTYTPGKLTYKDWYTLPFLASRPDAVTIRYTSGHLVVPEIAKAAIKNVTRWLYFERDGEDFKAGLQRVLERMQLYGY